MIHLNTHPIKLLVLGILIVFLYISVFLGVCLIHQTQSPRVEQKEKYIIWIGTGTVKVGYRTEFYSIENGYVIYKVDGKLFKSPECSVSIIESI